VQSSAVALSDRPRADATQNAPTQPRTEPVPRLLLWVSAGVVSAGVAMAVVGALRTGISWDEPFHVMRLRNFLGEGWFALDWSVDSAPAINGDDNTLVYGPVTMLLLHALGVLVGTEGWGEVATTPEAFLVRHLGVVAIGLIGTTAAAATTRVILGSWRWGLVTAAALLALPMWTGHLMFNIKDVPVATGYTLITLAMVSMVPPAHGHRVLRIGALAAGVVLMVGTRPAMATAVILGLLVLAAGTRLARPAMVDAAAGTALAVAVLVGVYPRVFTHPLLLARSADQSASFRNGETSDIWYLPYHLVAQFPLLLQGAALLGTAWAVGAVLRRRGSNPTTATRTALVVVQLGALPAMAVLRGSDLYNGLRQLLFMAPAWAVVVTLGLSVVVHHGRVRGRGAIVGAVAAAALVLPVADQATLFPYQYTYYNVGLDASMADVQTDYWRTSVQELLPRIPTDGQIVCGPTRSSRLGDTAGSPGAEGVEESDMFAGRYSSDSSVDCRIDPLGPLAPRWAADGLPRDQRLPHDEFYAIIDRGHALPANCTEVAAVTRHRHWRTVTMSYVARCRLDPSPLDGTLAFTRLPGENMEPPVWAYAPEGWTDYRSTTAIDATYAEASLTFAMPDFCDTAEGCALILDADAPGDLTAQVNDESVAVEVAAGRVVVPVTSGTTDTWVTFTRTSGAPLGLRLRTIRLVPTGTDQEENR
jgi:hypothetical protein